MTQVCLLQEDIALLGKPVRVFRETVRVQPVCYTTRNAQKNPIPLSVPWMGKEYHHSQWVFILLVAIIAHERLVGKAGAGETGKQR